MPSSVTGLIQRLVDRDQEASPGPGLDDHPLVEQDVVDLGVVVRDPLREQAPRLQIEQRLPILGLREPAAGLNPRRASSGL